jgi:Resolvase, N terminal domain
MEPSSVPTRCAVYCRISKDMAGDEHGVANQLEECRRYAAARSWVIVAEYVILGTHIREFPGISQVADVACEPMSSGRA